MTYRLIVDDNFHYMDERHEGGSFDTLEAAVKAAKAIVDDYLLSAYKAGTTTSHELFKGYASYGEDPCVFSTEGGGLLFSGWDYASLRCGELGSVVGPSPAPPPGPDACPDYPGETVVELWHSRRKDYRSIITIDEKKRFRIHRQRLDTSGSDVGRIPCWAPDERAPPFAYTLGHAQSLARQALQETAD